MKAKAWRVVLLTFVVGLSFSGCQSNELFMAPALSEMTVNQNRVHLQGLRWLEYSQNKNGSWGVGANEVPAATGLALLAFFWHGATNPSDQYYETVVRGMEFLMPEIQFTNGLVVKGLRPAFGNAIAVHALCEGYGYTLNPNLKYACEVGLKEILQGQRDSGLWDVCYRIDEGSDDTMTSVWQVLALKSGIMADLGTTDLHECLGRAADAMEKILPTETDIDQRVGLLLCLQLCGRGRSAVYRNSGGMATLTPDLVSLSVGAPIFRWYLAMQAFYNEGGLPWRRWQERIIPLLLKQQKSTRNANGEHASYWDSPHKEQRFSRVCTTALAVIILETFPPRRLPSYDPPSDEQVVQPDFGDVEVDVVL